MQIASRVALVCVVIVLGAATWIAIFNPDMNGDTRRLVVGAQGAVDCLREGRYTRCDKLAGGPENIGQWPLLQYVPAVGLRWAGASAESTLRTLIVLEALAVDAIVLIAWLIVRRRVSNEWALVVVATLVGSPLLWYATSAFGEALAAAMILAAIAAVLSGARPVLIGLLITIAGITKETSAPFVFVLALLCVLAAGEIAHRRRAIVAIVVGTVLGVVADAVFNLFRYGSVRNKLYLESVLQVPDTRTTMRFFGGLWVAPNGGLVWFWPSALVIIGLALVVCLRAMWVARRPTWETLTGPVVAGLLVIEIAGLSRWFSPFGWIAWGSRLTMPLMPAMIVVAVVCARTMMARPLHRFLTSTWFWVGAVAMTVVAVPQVAVLFQSKALDLFFDAKGICVNAHVQTSVPRFYDCNDLRMWRQRPFLLERGLEGLRTFPGRLVTVAFVVGLMALLVAARQHAARSARDAELVSEHA